MKTTIVHTPTQKSYDELMEIVKSELKDVEAFKVNIWGQYTTQTCVKINEAMTTYSPKEYYKKHHKDIPIISLKQFKDQMKTKTPTPAAKKSAIQKEQIIYQFITTTKTKWQIIKIGKEYMTRHVSPNGNILALNPKQFNRVQSAFKNIRVNAGAQLMLNKAAKVMKLPLTNISSYQKCYLK